MYRQSYHEKREEILSKFDKEFVLQNYTHDPVFHSIVEMLIRETDPYKIIQKLLEDRDVMMKKINNYLDYHGHPIGLSFPHLKAD